MNNPQENRTVTPSDQTTQERLDTDELQETANRQNPPSLKQNWLERVSSRRAMILLIGGSLLFILLAVASASYFFILRPRSMEIRSMSTPPASLDDLIKEFPELASILKDSRLDSVFKDFLISYQKGGIEAAYELAKKRGLLNKDDDLVLTLELDTSDSDSLKSELEAHGIIIATVSGNLMDIIVPMELIQKSIESGNPAGLFEDIAGLEHVKRIRMPIPYQPDGNIKIPIPDMNLKGLS
jgi:hypothetical protein